MPCPDSIQFTTNQAIGYKSLFFVQKYGRNICGGGKIKGGTLVKSFSTFSGDYVYNPLKLFNSATGGSNNSIYELMVFPKYIYDSEQSNVVSYLTAKYNL
jgi:hypothetical protein